MGSLLGANSARFMCRLCSQFKPIVIHIYGQQGRSLALHAKVLQLFTKVGAYHKATIRKFDKLPKTVCLACLGKLMIQCKLVSRIKYSYLKHTNHIEHLATSHTCPASCPFNLASDSSGNSFESEVGHFPVIDVTARKVDFRAFNPNSHIFMDTSDSTSSNAESVS